MSDTLFPSTAKTLHVTAYDKSFTRLLIAEDKALSAADFHDWMEANVIPNWGRDRHRQSRVYTDNFETGASGKSAVCDIVEFDGGAVVGHILCRVTEFVSETAPAEVCAFPTPNEDSAFRALGRRAA